MSGEAPVKFYCEFCGSLVRSGDRICPHCGSFFSQVRCPVCQFQGESHLFRQGCPVCGFAKANLGVAASAQGKGKAKSGKAAKPGYEVAYVIEDEKKAVAKSAAPVWVLAILGLIFLAIAIAAAIMAKG